MAAEPNRDGSRQSDLAVMDVDEYKQKRGLERILDDLHAIGDESREAWARFVRGENDRMAKNVAIQRVVKEAIWECKNMLVEYSNNTEGPDEYWVGREEEPLGEIELVDSTPVPIVGLKGFVECPEVIFEEVEKVSKHRNEPAETITETHEHSVPETISREAASKLTEFLANEKGIELATEAKEVPVHAEPW